jgi:phospholipase C
MSRWPALAFAAVLSACAGATPATVPSMQSTSALRLLDATGAGKIQHVVFIVQENRSFDNLFQGYPGADTVSSGKVSTGQTVALKPVRLAVQYQVDHSATAMFTSCDGHGKLIGTKCRMDAFDTEGSAGAPKGVKHPQYVYVPRKDSQPYWDMARQWVLADKTFASQLDESFTAHQYVIAAQAGTSVNLPNLVWGCGGGKYNFIYTLGQNRVIGTTRISPCFDYNTLGDELDKAQLSWRFYASSYHTDRAGGEWSGYQAVKHIRRGRDWKKVVSPNWAFITDVRAGSLANFTWITPVCDDSDHVDCGGGYGPSWVAALVNTVGKSKFWDSTAIFVIWDDWGGLYDHVPPPFKDYDGLGFRVPLLVISPYAKHGYVSHVEYETASVLRFAEDLFGLDRLAAADKRAHSPAADCFDFKQKPRAFVKIRAPKPPRFFMHDNGDEPAPDYE